MKSKHFFTILLAIALLLIIAMPVFAAAPGQAVDPQPGGFDDLLLQWGGLAGFAALIALLINVLKSVGVVKNDTAPTWSAGFNLVGLALLLATKTFKPELDMSAVDSQVMDFVNVGVVVFSYVLQLLMSKGTHFAVRGVPVIGKSDTFDKQAGS